jgi:hypothetical protein
VVSAAAPVASSGACASRWRTLPDGRSRVSRSSLSVASRSAACGPTSMGCSAALTAAPIRTVGRSSATRAPAQAGGGGGGRAALAPHVPPRAAERRASNTKNRSPSVERHRAARAPPSPGAPAAHHATSTRCAPSTASTAGRQRPVARTTAFASRAGSSRSARAQLPGPAGAGSGAGTGSPSVPAGPSTSSSPITASGAARASRAPALGCRTR